MRHHRSPRVLIRALPWLVVSVFVVALTAATPPNGESTRLLRSPTVRDCTWAVGHGPWEKERGVSVPRSREDARLGSIRQ
jgi:hypothetical protein